MAQIESFLSQYSLLEFFLQSRKYLGIKTDEYQISLETSQFPDPLFCQTQTILWLFFVKISSCLANSAEFVKPNLLSKTKISPHSLFFGKILLKILDVDQTMLKRYTLIENCHKFQHRLNQNHLIQERLPHKDV